MYEILRYRQVIFVINIFFLKTNLSEKLCVSVYGVDGAKAISNHITGLVGHIKTVLAKCMFTHYVLHLEALVAEHFPEKLIEVLDQSVKIVNFIKTRS